MLDFKMNTIEIAKEEYAEFLKENDYKTFEEFEADNYTDTHGYGIEARRQELCDYMLKSFEEHVMGKVANHYIDYDCLCYYDRRQGEALTFNPHNKYSVKNLFDLLVDIDDDNYYTIDFKTEEIIK